ncbi:hypothetical protein [Alkaliphilus transvaalensis]|uniref:hypothetical protein n=1 Tax=Alkaliphilus transvaalensis TaxID=114628 RepID=UPI0012EC47CD|nr:hypothetical protein [Alkaliphilus transvaalensis]
MMSLKECLLTFYNTTNHTFKSLEGKYGVTTIQIWVKDITPTDSSDESSLSPRNIAEFK